MLDAEGLQLYGSSNLNNTQQVYRIVKLPQLVGTKPVSVDGEQYMLEGYYPAILSQAEYDELQRVAAQSGRRRVKGELPHVITGLGITVCGYCGRPMAGQNLATKPRLPDGRIRDGYRRLLCASNAAYGGGCAVQASTSVAPIERAIMAYCSDIVNLQGLFGADRTEGPRARVATARTRVHEIELQLEKITDAMLASAAEGTPVVFARRARQLENDLQDAHKALQNAEYELANVARKDTQGADEAWRALTAGVEAQDVDARLRARQLVADTFERIVVYARGMRPDPAATERDYQIDLILVGRGGNSRALRIDRAGNLLSGFDAPEGLQANPQ